MNKICSARNVDFMRLPWGPPWPWGRNWTFQPPCSLPPHPGCSGVYATQPFTPSLHAYMIVYIIIICLLINILNHFFLFFCFSQCCIKEKNKVEVAMRSYDDWSYDDCKPNPGPFPSPNPCPTPPLVPTQTPVKTPVPIPVQTLVQPQPKSKCNPSSEI